MGTYDMAASLTLIRGRCKSSRSLELCSVRRLSLSSDMDCLCGREYMVVNLLCCCYRDGAKFEMSTGRVIG
jgi:hypothetical protein